VRRLEAENEDLRRQQVAQNLHGRELDEKLLGANQRRQDAIKRIDDLLAQLDHLDTRMAEQESDPSQARGVGSA